MNSNYTEISTLQHMNLCCALCVTVDRYLIVCFIL